MDDVTAHLLKRLSSRSVMERKAAIRELRRHIRSGGPHIARLSLHYVSEHDPCYTVRNIARQAFYSLHSPPPDAGAWEKVFLFHKE
jgi:hypothetical protein